MYDSYVFLLPRLSHCPSDGKNTRHPVWQNATVQRRLKRLEARLGFADGDHDLKGQRNASVVDASSTGTRSQGHWIVGQNQGVQRRFDLQFRSPRLPLDESIQRTGVAISHPQAHAPRAGPDVAMPMFFESADEDTFTAGLPRESVRVSQSRIANPVSLARCSCVEGCGRIAAPSEEVHARGDIYSNSGRRPVRLGDSGCSQ